ncbi:MAG: hypothetical protein C5B56_03875 [Proteobacteria bacterium]|nr:MAG: hypothetical protein C5B56_03875 [Pseudomonadota bacterium]
MREPDLHGCRGRSLFLRSSPSDARARRACLSSALFALLSALVLAGCSKTHPTVAILHATVIDATGSPPLPDTTVLISNHRIAAIGPSRSTAIPRGAQTIGASGKFLIPGLVDMHVHLTGSGEPAGSRQFLLPLLLANGITTVRDMGGYLESLVPLRREIREGERLGPDIFFAGPYLDGDPPSFQPSLVVTNAAEADKDVHDLVQQGVDFIKVQSILSRDAYFAIAAACKREHVAFAGHVPDGVTAAEASDASQRSIEHLTGILRACSSNERKLMRQQFYVPRRKQTAAQSQARLLAWQRELLRTQSEKFTAALIEEFVHNGTWQVPTLITLRNVAFLTPDQNFTSDPRTQLVPRSLLEAWRSNRANELRNASRQEFAVRKALFRRSTELVGKMNAAGVHLMAGTDTAAPFVFPGSSLHEELALLVEAGLTPMQSLEAATRNPAEFLGRLEAQGTISVGKLADLILLDANPLDDIHNTQKIRVVILGGHPVDRSALDQLVDSVRRFAAH